MRGDRPGVGHRARADTGERAERGGVSRVWTRFRSRAFRARDGNVRERRGAACALRRLQGPVVAYRMAGLDAGPGGHPAPRREELVLLGEGPQAAGREQQGGRRRGARPEEAGDGIRQGARPECSSHQHNRSPGRTRRPDAGEGGQAPITTPPAGPTVPDRAEFAASHGPSLARARESETVLEREPQRARSVTGPIVDFEVDPRARRVAKIDPQASPEGTIARIPYQADIGPRRFEEGTARQAVSAESERSLRASNVSGQSEPCLSPGAQCGGSWLRCPSADGKGS